MNHVRHANSFLSICKSMWCLHVVGVIGAYCVRVHICGVDVHVYNSYIPQMEQHEHKGQRLFCLGIVTYLLDVTPSNSMSYHPPIPLPVVQV